MATCDDDHVPDPYTPKTETETLQRLRALVEERLSSGLTLHVDATVNSK